MTSMSYTIITSHDEKKCGNLENHNIIGYRGIKMEIYVVQ